MHLSIPGFIQLKKNYILTYTITFLLKYAHIFKYLGAKVLGELIIKEVGNLYFDQKLYYYNYNLIINMSYRRHTSYSQFLYLNNIYSLQLILINSKRMYLP